MQRYNFSIIPPKKCGRKQCVLSVSYLKSPKPQCLSAFQRSEIRVTTEAERRQNGGRTYEGRSLDSDRIS